MCLAGQVLPLLDTRRTGHQVFTVLTLDIFCLLLFHITKEKKKKKREHSEDELPQSSQSSSELQVKPSPPCQVTQSWGKVQFSEVHVPGCSIFLKFHQRNRKRQHLSGSSSLTLGLPQPHFWCATKKVFSDTMTTRSHTPAWPKGNIGTRAHSNQRLGNFREKKKKILF